MIAIAVVFLVLAVISILPVLLIALGGYSGSTIERLEALITEHDSLIVSLGTLALVSALAMLTTGLSTRSAEKREKSSQKVQAELKIAEFRQDWIGSFRSDLSRYGLLLFIKNKSPEDHRERLQLEMKLHMRLNLDEPLAKNLEAAMKCARLDGQGDDQDARKKAYKELVLAGNEFLRNEWKRLVGDIKEARLLEKDIP